MVRLVFDSEISVVITSKRIAASYHLKKKGGILLSKVKSWTRYQTFAFHILIDPLPLSYGNIPSLFHLGRLRVRRGKLIPVVVNV